MPQQSTVRRLSAALAAVWGTILKRSTPADPMAAAFTELAQELSPRAVRRPAPAIEVAPRRRAA